MLMGCLFINIPISIIANLLYLCSELCSIGARDFYIQISAWDLRCSLNYTGQCESLEAWTSSVQISTLFFIGLRVLNLCRC